MHTKMKSFSSLDLLGAKKGTLREGEREKKNGKEECQDDFSMCNEFF